MIDLVIRPLTADLLHDYLHFFDEIAFADNPKWSSCYCHFTYAPHELKPWAQRTADENRAAISRLINKNEARGFLAYVGAEPVGWCNAGPKRLYTIVPEATESELKRTGSIVCFVVAKAFRGKGIASLLLEAACEGLKSQGLELAEAYPRKTAETQAANHFGPLRMYLRAGFTAVDEVDGTVIVRKELL